MFAYWETKYKEAGALWKFEPADSADSAMKLFKLKQFRKILIPGVGYGRNAKLFVDNGFEVTGIEVSGSAIDLARQNGLNFPIRLGSVTQMPFDKIQYDGIFCYALIHLLSRPERRTFLEMCFNQLISGGIMVFVVASTQMSLYGQGKLLSKDRYSFQKGLNVFFYNQESVVREFLDFGLTDCTDIEEPIKFMENEPPIPMKFIVCQKESV